MRVTEDMIRLFGAASSGEGGLKVSSRLSEGD